MPAVRVNCFTISADGFGAGVDQSIVNPLGVGGMALHKWMVGTRTFHEMVLKSSGGESGADDDLTRQGFENVGAWILGRNMFGPVRGPWPDESWKGWWGDEPPYHVPVFVLTHHARGSIEMKGGTVFHFVTDGVHAALERAKAAAGAKDVRIGGGVSTIRQYLAARLIDSLHIAVSPVLLGSGESLFGGLDLVRLGYRIESNQNSPLATHLMLAKA